MATAKKNVKSTPAKAITAAPPAKAISAAPPAKAIEAEPPVKVLEVKADKTEEAVVKETAKKAPEKKAPAKKAPAKKAPAKAPATKAASKTATSAKKGTLKTSIQLQFAGKEYTEEDLIKIAKDVWQYDLNEELDSLKSVQLFVKPEESKVYYIINDTTGGCFDI